VPIVSAQNWVKALVDGLTWPVNMTNVNPLEAWVTPPDPNVEAQTPQGYVWPRHGIEARDPLRGGSLPRAATLGAPSGLKTQTHRVELYLVWWGADDDPDADALFPGMVDWVMATLRASPDVSPLQTDPWSGIQSYMLDVGERMDYELSLRASVDQRYNRYDSLITLVVNEVFPS